MEIRSIGDAVLFVSAALSIKDALVEAVAKKTNLRAADLSAADLSAADLRGANLYGADLRGADLRGANLYGADLSAANLYGANLRGADLSAANLSAANLYAADLYAADLRGANLRGKKIAKLRAFSGLYEYEVWAVLFEDGSRWVRMGCHFKSLEAWKDAGGIRKINLAEFPDDGSERSEQRAIAFDFARAAVLRMNVVEVPAATISAI